MSLLLASPEPQFLLDFRVDLGPHTENRQSAPLCRSRRHPTVKLEKNKMARNLQQQALIGPNDGAAPVDALVERQPPAVAEQHGHAARRQRLQEAVRAEPPPARHQAERRVGQQLPVVEPAW